MKPTKAPSLASYEMHTIFYIYHYGSSFNLIDTSVFIAFPDPPPLDFNPFRLAEPKIT